MPAANLDFETFDQGFALTEIVDVGHALDFRSTASDFAIRLSTSGQRKVAEHSHDNIQVSIPLGNTIARVAWRTGDGTLHHAQARRGHAVIVPARQRHAISWKSRARFVNLHLSQTTTDDERHRFLRRVDRLGETHVLDDPFLARFGEIVVLMAMKHGGLNDVMLESFRAIVEAHIMSPYPSAPLPPLLEAARRRIGKAPRAAPALTAPQMKTITGAVLADIGRNWTVEAMAKRLGISSGHFARGFRSLTGIPPRQWVIQQRVEAAMDKLLMTTETLAEIAYACGFSEQSHFTRTFRRVVGSSPGAWRRHHQPQP